MIQYDSATQEVIHPDFGYGELRGIDGDLMLFAFPGSLYVWEEISKVWVINKLARAEAIWRNHKCRAS